MTPKLDATLLAHLIAAECDPANMLKPTSGTRDLIVAARVVFAIQDLADAVRAFSAQQRVDARRNRKARKL